MAKRYIEHMTEEQHKAFLDAAERIGQEIKELLEQMPQFDHAHFYFSDEMLDATISNDRVLIVHTETGDMVADRVLEEDVDELAMEARTA